MARYRRNYTYTPPQMDFFTPYAAPGATSDGSQDQAQAEIARLQRRVQTLEASRTVLQQETSRLVALTSRLQQEVILARMMSGSGSGANADEALKRDILKIAHRRYSGPQGQPATELAHEICVRLTAGRKPRR